MPQSIISRKGLVDDKFVDNPTDHEGRLRSFAHERGNWATYVYIPCKLTLRLIFVFLLARTPFYF